ncbi:MAG TPA: hypothetical protein VFN75_11830 [Pseudonocardiaceae bacterium]|nr:hypothetical protein [Pseudonocardiaceae bacterium]
MSTPVAAFGAAAERAADSLRTSPARSTLNPSSSSMSIAVSPRWRISWCPGTFEVGRDVIAATSAGAVLSLRKVAGARDVTIKLSGMPAEESGEGEVPLLQQGVINDVAMEMMVHLAVEEAGSRASSRQASAAGGAV